MTTQTSPLDRLYARFLALHPDLPMSHLAAPPADDAESTPEPRYIVRHKTPNRAARRRLPGWHVAQAARQRDMRWHNLVLKANRHAAV